MQAHARMVESVWIQVMLLSANAPLDLLEVFVKEVCKRINNPCFPQTLSVITTTLAICPFNPILIF